MWLGGCWWGFQGLPAAEGCMVCEKGRYGARSGSGWCQPW